MDQLVQFDMKYELVTSVSVSSIDTSSEYWHNWRRVSEWSSSEDIVTISSWFVWSGLKKREEGKEKEKDWLVSYCVNKQVIYQINYEYLFLIV